MQAGLGTAVGQVPHEGSSAACAHDGEHRSAGRPSVQLCDLALHNAARRAARTPQAGQGVHEGLAADRSHGDARRQCTDEAPPEALALSTDRLAESGSSAAAAQAPIASEAPSAAAGAAAHAPGSGRPSGSGESAAEPPALGADRAAQSDSSTKAAQAPTASKAPPAASVAATRTHGNGRPCGNGTSSVEPPPLSTDQEVESDTSAAASYASTASEASPAALVVAAHTPGDGQLPDTGANVTEPPTVSVDRSTEFPDSEPTMAVAQASAAPEALPAESGVAARAPGSALPHGIGKSVAEPLMLESGPPTTVVPTSTASEAPHAGPGDGAHSHEGAQPHGAPGLIQDAICRALKLLLSAAKGAAPSADSGDSASDTAGVPSLAGPAPPGRCRLCRRAAHSRGTAAILQVCKLHYRFFQTQESILEGLADKMLSELCPSSGSRRNVLFALPPYFDQEADFSYHNSKTSATRVEIAALLVEFLLARGHDVRAENAWGLTPLQYSLFLVHQEPFSTVALATAVGPGTAYTEFPAVVRLATRRCRDWPHRPRLLENSSDKGLGKSEAESRAVVASLEQFFGAEHPAVATARRVFADSLGEATPKAECSQPQEEPSITWNRHKSDVIFSVAVALQIRGDHEAAARRLREQIQLDEPALGTEHVRVLQGRCHLACSLLALEDTGGAAELLLHVLDVGGLALGDIAVHALRCMLACVQLHSGEEWAANAALSEAYSACAGAQDRSPAHRLQEEVHQFGTWLDHPHAELSASLLASQCHRFAYFAFQHLTGGSPAA
uniref:Uncharacterized protein n=1 Tax=Alexandrium monilatum TaxID=311494 RepID=A0A7S4UUB4_9DINO